MKIVCDDKIPFIQPALQELADELVMKAGSAISASDVRDADILVVRTRTHCNQALLAGSQVRLIVTATIGYDHLDTNYLESVGIQWANCPGCNATSVAQYVRNSLIALQQDRHRPLAGCTLGIIGVGHVGTAVWEALRDDTCVGPFRRILLNDPLCQHFPLANYPHTSWCKLPQLLEEADIITFHTPLTVDGPAPTFHLADATFFQRLRQRPIIINAARGGVVDEQALLQAMDAQLVDDVIIDTWEGEPHIQAELLRRAYIATPHVAGYSADGKANATRMTLATICRFLHQPMTFDIKPPTLPDADKLSSDPIERALQLYDPRHDSQRLKAEPDKFEWLRGHYPLRREHAS